MCRHMVWVDADTECVYVVPEGGDVVSVLANHGCCKVISLETVRVQTKESYFSLVMYTLS